VLFLLCAILATYYTALEGQFVSDDWPVIAENPRMRTASAVVEFFTSGVWANTDFKAADAALYRPVHLLWIFLVFSLFGGDPFWFHAVHLVLHAVNALLVLRLIEWLRPESTDLRRMLAASLFAIHPALTQNLAWISGGTDVLLSFFLLSGLLAYLRYRDSGKPRALVAAMALFLAGTLTKETAIVFPLLLGLCDLMRGARYRDLPFRAYAIALGVVGAYFVLRYLALDRSGASSGLVLSFPGLLRLGEYYLLAIRFILLPWPQPMYFAYPQGGIANAFDVAVGLTGLALMAAVALRFRALSYPALWILVTLLPPFAAAFHPQGVFALRFLYLPMIGGAILIAALPAGAIARRRGAVALASGILVLIFMSVTTLAIRDWRDEGTLYAKVLAQNSQDASGYEGLTRHYERIGDLPAAIDTYREAIDRLTDERDRLAQIEGLALLHARNGQHALSIETYRKMASSPLAAQAYVGIANNYWSMQRFDEALAAYERAISLDPGHFYALWNYARLNETLGRHDAASIHYRRVLEISDAPGNPDAIKHAEDYLKTKP
jgi:tetratricopeptide (TPR) repeat protein